MIKLDKTACREFVAIFGNLHDALLNELHYSPKDSVASLVIEAMDNRTTTWSRLVLSFENVKYFYYNNGRSTSMNTTVLDGINADVFFEQSYGNLVFIDFAPTVADSEDPVANLEYLKVDDYFNSNGMCAAETVYWESKPI